MLEMMVEHVRVNPVTQQHVVILKRKEEERYLFIWVAQAEASAIAVELHGMASPRPSTYDLIQKVLDAARIELMRVVIHDLVDQTFYTRLVLNVAGKEVEIESRPSDAIAQAVRVGAPIFVAEEVLARAGVVVERGPEASTGLERPGVETVPQGEKREGAEAVKKTAAADDDELHLLRAENKQLRAQMALIQQHFPDIHQQTPER